MPWVTLRPRPRLRNLAGVATTVASAFPLDRGRWQQVCDLARRDAADGAAANRLTDAVADALRDSGALKALLPTELGGAAASLPQLCELVAELSEHDGAAGWVLQICAGTAWFAGWMPPELAGEVFGRGGAWVAGSGAPGRVVPVTGTDGSPGWSVRGRWGWCSGAPWATALTLATLDPDGASGVVVVDPSSVRFDADWSIRGLQATASWTASVDGLVVPASHRFVMAAPVRPEPLFRMPFTAFAEALMAAVSVGLGRALIREFVALASGKVPFGASSVLADDPVVQHVFGRQAAALGAAAHRFATVVAEIWDAVADGVVSAPLELEMTLAALGAVDAGAAAARTLGALAGTDLLHPSAPFARVVADLVAVPCNTVVAPARFGAAGAALLGRSSGCVQAAG